MQYFIFAYAYCIDESPKLDIEHIEDGYNALCYICNLYQKINN